MRVRIQCIRLVVSQNDDSKSSIKVSPITHHTKLLGHLWSRYLAIIESLTTRDLHKWFLRSMGEEWRSPEGFQTKRSLLPLQGNTGLPGIFYDHAATQCLAIPDGRRIGQGSGRPAVALRSIATTKSGNRAYWGSRSSPTARPGHFTTHV